MPRYKMPGARRKAAATTAVKEENRRDKFLRLSERRMTRALNDLRLMENCFSANYEHDEQHARFIVSTLRAGVERVEAKAFRKKGKQVLAFSWEGRAEAH